MTKINQNQNHFLMPSNTAVLAYQIAGGDSRLMELFQSEFIERLAAWCAEHDSEVSRCYIPCERFRKCIKVFVSRSATFDFQLSDAISELESQFINSGWNCNILQIASRPGDEYQPFFDVSTSIQVS